MTNRTLKLLTILGFLLLCLFCSMCSIPRIEAKLAQNVQAKLASMLPEGATIPTVSFNGRYGTLEGNLSDEGTINKLLDAAKQVKGVNDITNNLSVGDGNLPLSGNDLPSLNASFDDSGKLVLGGLLPTNDSKNRILANTKQVMGENNVLDNMKVGANNLLPSGAEAILGYFISNGANITAGNLDISETGITLKGTVASDALKGQFSDFFAQNYPSLSFNNLLSVSAPSNVELQNDLNALLSKGTIEFETGSATIKATSNEFIRQVASVLKTDTNALVEIQGHTDNVGSAQVNQELSQKRAQSVKDFLQKEGVPNPDRLTARGYGASNPIADNDTASGRARNRRVVFRVL